jgi:hypothetical protein
VANLDNLTDVEKQALSEMNRMLNRHFADLLNLRGAVTQSGLVYDDGTDAEFALKPRQNLYRHWTHGQTWYCYTPWKDTRNWYWVFNYVNRGGQMELVKAVKLRKRETAKKRAYNRYAKVAGKPRW